MSRRNISIQGNGSWSVPFKGRLRRVQYWLDTQPKLVWVEYSKELRERISKYRPVDHRIEIPEVTGHWVRVDDTPTQFNFTEALEERQKINRI